MTCFIAMAWVRPRKSPVESRINTRGILLVVLVVGVVVVGVAEEENADALVATTNFAAKVRRVPIIMSVTGWWLP